MDKHLRFVKQDWRYKFEKKTRPLLHITVLSRSAIVVQSQNLVTFLCCQFVVELSAYIESFVIELNQISFFVSFCQLPLKGELLRIHYSFIQIH